MLIMARNRVESFRPRSLGGGQKRNGEQMTVKSRLAELEREHQAIDMRLPTHWRTVRQLI
jgi:hypothetical protein